MKQILFILIILVSACGNNVPPVKVLEQCINGDESVCQTLPEETEIPPEEEEELVPFTSSWSPNPPSQPDEFYNDTLYIKSFNTLNFHFVNTNIIDRHGYTVFRSSNDRYSASLDARIYAKVYIMPNHKLIIQFYRSHDNRIMRKWERQWYIDDKFKLFISTETVKSELKTEEEVINGAQRWKGKKRYIARQDCFKIIIIKLCSNVYKYKQLYANYYWE